MNRTLYITDLDGTLMNSTPRVTEYTAGIINSLVEKGHAVFLCDRPLRRHIRPAHPEYHMPHADNRV